MAVNHADHDHPATPKARAACRALLAATGTTNPHDAIDVPAGKRGDGRRKVINAAKAVRGPRPGKSAKKPGSYIRTDADMADVPRVFGPAIRVAWTHDDWAVVVGTPYNEAERNIRIATPTGEITMAWKTANPDGIHGVWWRAKGTSVWSRYPLGVNEAIRQAEAVESGA